MFHVCTIPILPFLCYDKSHAWCLHDRYILRFPIRTVVLLLRHHTSNSKRNHSFGADGVLDLNHAIFFSFWAICISCEVDRGGAELATLLAAVSDDLFQYGRYDAAFLAAVVVRLGADVWWVVPPVGRDRRATSAGSYRRKTKINSRRENCSSRLVSSRSRHPSTLRVTKSWCHELEERKRLGIRLTIIHFNVYVSGRNTVK